MPTLPLRAHEGRLGGSAPHPGGPPNIPRPPPAAHPAPLASIRPARARREGCCIGPPGTRPSVTGFPSAAAHHKCPTGTTPRRRNCVLSMHGKQGLWTARRGSPGEPRTTQLWTCRPAFQAEARTPHSAAQATGLPTHPQDSGGARGPGPGQAAREGQASCHGPLVASLGQLSHPGQEKPGQAKSPRSSAGPPRTLRGPALSLPPPLSGAALRTPAGRHRLPQLPGPSAGPGAGAQRVGGRRGTGPSAYLMLKPVVWSSRSQLRSFASSLCKDRADAARSTCPAASCARAPRRSRCPALALAALSPTHRAPTDPHTGPHHEKLAVTLTAKSPLLGDPTLISEPRCRGAPSPLQSGQLAPRLRTAHCMPAPPLSLVPPPRRLPAGCKARGWASAQAPGWPALPWTHRGPPPPPSLPAALSTPSRQTEPWNSMPAPTPARRPGPCGPRAAGRRP